MVIVLNPNIKKVDRFALYLSNKGYYTIIGFAPFNTIDGAKVTTNEHRKLINDLYNECF